MTDGDTDTSCELIETKFWDSADEEYACTPRMRPLKASADKFNDIHGAEPATDTTHAKPTAT